MGMHLELLKISWSALVLVLWLLQKEAVGSGWTRGHLSVVGAPPQSWERKPRETSPEDKRTRISQDLVGRSLAIDTLMDNETQIVEDNHSYYISRIYGPGEVRAKELWVDIAKANRSQVKVHGILSNTHRQASRDENNWSNWAYFHSYTSRLNTWAMGGDLKHRITKDGIVLRDYMAYKRVMLSFDFPFYGHHLRQVTIATGGFLFMGDIIHRMLTATQYVAPLMANFNPSYSRNSTIKYFDNGTLLVVQWDQVYLEGKENRGYFIFQAALHSDGRIVFGYKEIPMSVLEIGATQHPVKAGLSDAFMILNSTPGVPESHRRTIYEYHRVELDTSKIVSASAVEFVPLPTCLQHQSCEVCVTSDLTFNCSWCHVLQRCSSGFDRYREEWLEYGCGQKSEEKTCTDSEENEHYTSSLPSSTPFTPLREDVTTSSHFINSLTTEDDTKMNQIPEGEDLLHKHPEKKVGSHLHTGTIIGIVLAVLFIAVIILAGIYITSNPTSSAALFFLKRRPHQRPVMKFRNHSAYTEVEPAGYEKEGFVEADQC